MRTEPRTFGLVEHVQRSRPGTQHDVLVGRRIPGRAVRIHARQRSGDRSGIGECLVTAAQPVEGLDAREAHQRVIALQAELAQALHHVVAGFPVRGRIDQQQGALVTAELRGHQQHARPPVAIARRRRQADEMQVLDRAQREQARTALGGPDEVVIGQWRAVVPVRVGVDVADRMACARPERPVGARVGHVATHPHQRAIPAERW